MSECTMSICGSEADGQIEFYNVTRTKARKCHRCSECSRVISPGQYYGRHTGKFDGSMICEKVCEPCEEIREAFTDPGGDSPLMGELWECMEQEFSVVTTGCFSRLETAEAKALLRDRWMKWKGLAA